MSLNGKKMLIRLVSITWFAVNKLVLSGQQVVVSARFHIAVITE